MSLKNGLSFIIYILMGLNQYRLMLIIDKNTVVMEELNQKIIHQEIKITFLESSLKSAQTLSYLQANKDIILIASGVFTVIAIIYLSTQCAGSVNYGISTFFKSVNDGTKEISSAAAGVLNRVQDGTDASNIKSFSVFDSVDVKLTIKPIATDNGIGASGLFITPPGQDRPIFIENIYELYLNNLKLQDILNPKWDSVDYFKDIPFDPFEELF